jgi:WD40 repeat protein
MPDTLFGFFYCQNAPISHCLDQVADIIALQSDSKHIISSSSDSTVRVWVPTQRRCIQVLEPFPCIVTSLNWHNSMLFLGGQKGQLAAYSTTTWEVVSAIDEVRASKRQLPCASEA